MIVRRLLGMWIVLVLVASGAAAVEDRIDTTSDGGTVAGGSTAATADPSLNADQVRVSGVVTAVHVEDAVVPPVPLPVTITAPSAGMGNGADIEGITIDGGAATIVWDAGRPLQLGGAGPLRLDPVTLDLAPDGFRLGLGGTVVAFTPGEHRIDTPVAVGQSGLARPKDSVTFTTGDRSRMALRGTATLLYAPAAPLALTGPGKVVLTGELTVVTATGSRTVRSIELAKGPFEVTLTRGLAGYVVEALLQGATTTT